MFVAACDITQSGRYARIMVPAAYTNIPHGELSSTTLSVLHHPLHLRTICGDRWASTEPARPWHGRLRTPIAPHGMLCQPLLLTVRDSRPRGIASAWLNSPHGTSPRGMQHAPFTRSARTGAYITFHYCSRGPDSRTGFVTWSDYKAHPPTAPARDPSCGLNLQVPSSWSARTGNSISQFTGRFDPARRFYPCDRHCPHGHVTCTSCWYQKCELV